MDLSIEDKEYLNSEIIEDEGITNLDVINNLFGMLKKFYKFNGLLIEEEGNLYNEFVKFVLEHSK